MFFLHSSAQSKTNLTYPFLLLVVFVFVFLFRRFCSFHSQGRYGRCLHACVRKIRRIWWIRHDGSCTFRTRAVEVSSTAVRGGFDRFLMIYPGRWVRIHHVTKNTQGSRGRLIEQGKISPLLLHVLVMPLCSDRPRKYSILGGETA